MIEPFVTADGKEIPLRRVARRHIVRIRSKYVMPEPPTYTVTLVGGGIQELPHNSTTLTTAEDHRIWNEYQQEANRLTTELNRELVRFLLYSCVAIEPPPSEEWSLDWKLWGLSLPDTTDPIEYKIEWIESELIIDPGDMASLISRLFELGGIIDHDMVSEFEQFFRVALERAGIRES